MWKISAAEKRFLQDGVANNMRNDGRGNLDYRPIILETGVISQTNGSARVKLVGNPSTDVLVGVKLEIGEPSLSTPDRGAIHFSVECSTSASPEFEGKGGESLESELSAMLSRTILLELTQLCIIPGHTCWIVYVDAYVLDAGGNLFDAIAIATHAALATVEVPKMEINLEAKTFELDDDPDSWTRLNIDDVPVCVSFGKIGKSYVVDATQEEELCVSVRLTVAVNKKGDICGIQKGGNAGGVNPSALKEMIQSAKRIGVQLNEKLSSAIAEEKKQRRNKVGFFA